MKVKKLNKNAVLPKYAKKNDSGFDLVACEDTIIGPGETKLIKTGLAFDIPEGFEIQIRPRSGITAKTKLRVQFGTVDAGYRGEVKICIDNLSDEGWSRMAKTIENTYDGDTLNDVLPGSYIIRKGDRIAQGVIAPVCYTTFVEAKKLSDSERGTKGFGHSGVR